MLSQVANANDAERAAVHYAAVDMLVEGVFDAVVIREFEDALRGRA